MDAGTASSDENESHYEEPPVTMGDLFVSGYDEVLFEPDELIPHKNVIRARMSNCEFDSVISAGIPNREFDNDSCSRRQAVYVPDPPCILPFEDEQDRDQVPVVQTQPEIQEYWKRFAEFLEFWPNIKVIRDSMHNFRTLWLSRPVGSRLRAFVCISQNSVGERYRPVMDDDQRNGQVIRPGQCVAIEAISAGHNMRFLKLPGPGAGWLFDRKDGIQLMCEMKNLEVGLWWYRVVAKTPQELRKYPTFHEDGRNGWILASDEVVMVDLRCRISGYNFFHILDGRGWMFEFKPVTMRSNRRRGTCVFSLCDDDFVDVDCGTLSFFKSLVPPTNEVVEVGLWTYVVNLEPVLAIGTARHGHFLRPGDVVKVDKRANSNGNPAALGGPGIQNRRWLRLGGNQGWVPETNARGKKLMLEQKIHDVAYPSWFKPSEDVNMLAETWHAGIV